VDSHLSVGARARQWREITAGAPFRSVDASAPLTNRLGILAKLVQGTVCKILGQEEIKPHKVRPRCCAFIAKCKS
jgi:hypothetical protein